MGVYLMKLFSNLSYFNFESLSISGGTTLSLQSFNSNISIKYWLYKVFVILYGSEYWIYKIYLVCLFGEVTDIILGSSTSMLNLLCLKKFF